MSIVDQVIRQVPRSMDREADQVDRIRTLLLRADDDGMSDGEIVDRIAAILGARLRTEDRSIYQKPLG